MFPTVHPDIFVNVLHPPSFVETESCRSCEGQECDQQEMNQITNCDKTAGPNSPYYCGPRSCDGPRYVRGQPSRSTPGVLLSEKYVTEFDKDDNEGSAVDFNLVFRNSVRYVKELQNNWSKLTPEQREVILKDLGPGIGNLMSKKLESFSGNVKDLTEQDKNIVAYLTENPDNFKSILNHMKNNNVLKSYVNYNYSNEMMITVIVIVVVFLLLGVACGSVFR